MGGEWGIRAPRDSTAMKDSAFAGFAALSMFWEGPAEDAAKKDFK
jgi:hypothetical protein